MSRLGSASLLVLVVACAAGNDDSTTSSSSSSGGSGWSGGSGAGTTNTTNNTGGAVVVGGSGGELANGGSGGVSTSTTGGAGGQTTSAGGSGGDGGAIAAGGFGGMGGSPPVDEGELVVVANSTSTVLAGHFEPMVGWSTQSLNSAPASGSAPAAAIADVHDAIVMFRGATNGDLVYSLFDGVQFSAPANVAAGVTTRDTPSLIANSTVGRSVVFHGDDFKHYYGAYTSSWNPAAEAVGGVASQSFGPSPGSLTFLGSDVVFVFAGNNHDLYDQTRTSGGWQSAQGHGLGDALLLRPSIVALDQGPELMVAFVGSADQRIRFTTRSSGIWSAPVVVDQNALTNDAISLAPMSAGRAVLAFRGQNAAILYSVYNPGANPPWTTPAVVVSNSTTPSTPAVARGIGAADAEIAFVSSSGVVAHSRLMGGNAWSAPALIGGTNITSVALASRE